MIKFGREICNHLPTAERREWLVTNGIGGFACGTISGLLTRRYHGLLIAALKPPLERTLLLTKFDETVTYQKQVYPLFANRWADKTVDPNGFHHLEQFRLEGTTPIWTFACADALLQKRIWMQPEANTTYIHYSIQRSTAPLVLSLKALVNYRDYHGATQADKWTMQIDTVPHGLKIAAFENATPFYLLSDHAEIQPQHDWYQNFHLSVEAHRGLSFNEDHLYIGTFRFLLTPEQSLTLVASTEPNPTLNGNDAYTKRQTYEQTLLHSVERQKSGEVGKKQNEEHLACIRQLTLAADQFIVRRPLSDDSKGRSIIAGYPWFSDWGRDTMIALPGLTLTTGRFDIAQHILTTFARFVNNGMLPNRFPDTAEEPEYNTVDATLWYFHAIHQYFEFTKDKSLIETLYPTLTDIIDWHEKGTRYAIHVDSKDGLLYAGEPGWQLTWMDAKVGNWVVTPRIGKPVEVNALWHNALRVMVHLAKQLEKANSTVKWFTEKADLVAQNFQQRFWYETGGYLCDVIDGPGGDPGYDGKRYDRRIRPNQILAVSLPFKLLTDEQAKSVVDVCTRHLLTPYGLRSLAPKEPSYKGHYGGGQYDRDGAYHQGTVWAWLIGHFVQAHLHVYQDPALARSYLEPLIQHLSDACIGNISEIFDGDPPFTPRGCFAQAWSVAELLRAWQVTTEA